MGNYQDRKEVYSRAEARTLQKAKAEQEAAAHAAHVEYRCNMLVKDFNALLLDEPESVVTMKNLRFEVPGSVECLVSRVKVKGFKQTGDKWTETHKVDVLTFK